MYFSKLSDRFENTVCSRWMALISYLLRRVTDEQIVYRQDVRMRINYVPNRARDLSPEQTNLPGADWKFSVSRKFRNTGKRKFARRAFLRGFKCSAIRSGGFRFSEPFSILRGKKERKVDGGKEKERERHKSIAPTKHHAGVAKVALFAAESRAEYGMRRERAR